MEPKWTNGEFIMGQMPHPLHPFFCGGLLEENTGPNFQTQI